MSNSAAIVENDDETDRLQHRLHKNQPRVSEAEKRSFFGLGFRSKMSDPRIADDVSNCIRLCAEDKINAKNAFSLKIIDFMSHMMKEGDMINLPVASTLLDVSTRIYGFRVDRVLADTLRMIGSWDKQEKLNGRLDSAIGEENSDHDCNNDVETLVKMFL